MGRQKEGIQDRKGDVEVKREVCRAEEVGGGKVARYFCPFC
jgi:hypothetical protein